MIITATTVVMMMFCYSSSPPNVAAAAADAAAWVLLQRPPRVDPQQQQQRHQDSQRRRQGGLVALFSSRAFSRNNQAKPRTPPAPLCRRRYGRRRPLLFVSVSSSEERQRQQEEARTAADDDPSSIADDRDASDDTKRDVPLLSRQFYEDMVRVLESHQQQQQQRQQHQQQQEDNHLHDERGGQRQSSSLPSRQDRPALLESDPDGAERVLTMLQHLISRQPRLVTVEMLVLVMRAFLKRGRSRWMVPSTSSAAGRTVICAADQLESLLEEWLQMQGQEGTDNESSSATTTTAATLADAKAVDHDEAIVMLEMYNLVLEGYAVCSTPRGNRNYAAKARRLYHDLLEQQEQFDDDCDADRAMIELMRLKSLQHVLHATAWQQANLEPGVCAREAHNLLLDMKRRLRRQRQHGDLSREQVYSLLMPCYHWVLEAWSKSGSPGSAQKADEIFEQMKRLHASITTATPTIAPEALAQEQERRQQQDLTISYGLDAEAYTNVILAWAKTVRGDDDDNGDGYYNNGDDSSTYASNNAQRATDLFLEMIEFCKQQQRQQHQANRDAAAPPRCSMELSSSQRQSTASASSPVLMALNGVIAAWGHAGRADRAEEILRQMLDKADDTIGADDSNDSTTTALRPDLVSFNSVLHAYYRGCTTTTGGGGGTNDIKKKKHRASTMLLDEEAMQKVVSLVEYMENSRSMGQRHNFMIEPNCFTYNVLMKCWMHSVQFQTHPDQVALEVEQILYKMEPLWLQQRQRNGNEKDTSIPANNRPYNMVLNALAKSSSRNPGACSKAVVLLQRMKTLPEPFAPDIISYTTVMECLSKSTSPTTTTATSVLSKGGPPEEKEENGLQQRHSYSVCDQAVALLQEAFALYNQTNNDPALKPNARTFTMAICTLANNGGSAVRARELLTQLTDLYRRTQDPDLRPNAYPYNYVLNCAANTMMATSETASSSSHSSMSQQRAFTIAAQTFQEMRHSDIVRPDCFTYAFWFKCCNNLLPEGSDLKLNCVQYALEECKSKGLLSNEVLKRICQGNAPAVVRRLLLVSGQGEGNEEEERFVVSAALQRRQRDEGRPFLKSLRITDLPPQWSRNVNKTKKRKKKQQTR